MINLFLTTSGARPVAAEGRPQPTQKSRSADLCCCIIAAAAGHCCAQRRKWKATTAHDASTAIVLRALCVRVWRRRHCVGASPSNQIQSNSHRREHPTLGRDNVSSLSSARLRRPQYHTLELGATICLHLFVAVAAGPLQRWLITCARSSAGRPCDLAPPPPPPLVAVVLRTSAAAYVGRPPTCALWRTGPSWAVIGFDR